MTTFKGLLLVFVTLLSTCNALCILGVLELSACLLFKPCNLGNLLGPCNGAPISISLSAGDNEFVLNTRTPIAGLSISASGSGSVLLTLSDGVTINGDLSLVGATVQVVAGASVSVAGSVRVEVGSTLYIAGNLFAEGATTVNGHLDMGGKNARLHSSVTLSGTTNTPASITGNGAIEGSVTVVGTAITGVTGSDSSLRVSERVQVDASSVLKVAGNLTAAAVMSSGRLHLDGVLVGNSHRKSWLISDRVEISGVESKLTGNGGILGDVTLGEYSTFAPGNSPGVVEIGGNLLMYPTSNMEIEVASASSFDRYVVWKILYRNGHLRTIFLSGFLPNTNDRYSFGSHQNATGGFITVSSTHHEVLAAYSNKSTMFIFDDPQITSHCTCTLVV